MKKIKILVASVLCCAMGYTGYTTYEKMTMSEAEKFMIANVEALTSGEAAGGISVVTCLGLTNKECVTSAEDRSTGPLVRVEPWLMKNELPQVIIYFVCILNKIFHGAVHLIH